MLGVLETVQRARAKFLADFTLNFASETARVVPAELPEQAREVAQTKCNA